jgi:glutathione S-transferase
MASARVVNRVRWPSVPALREFAGDRLLPEGGGSPGVWSCLKEKALPADRLPPEADITFYHSLASRSFGVRWMLEEIGVAYATVEVDISRQQQKEAGYLRLNPMGKVPALIDHGQVITESTAICLYLADRYALGGLAPAIDDPRRGPYTRWAVYSTSVLEPGIRWRVDDPAEGRHRGWGDYGSIIRTLETTLEGRPWILGEEFSGADVMLGAVLLPGMFNRLLPRAGPIQAYHDRLAGRPAAKAAAAATWPPEIFGQA